jgi:hypothetical protein
MAAAAGVVATFAFAGGADSRLVGGAAQAAATINAEMITRIFFIGLTPEFIGRTRAFYSKRND